MEKRNVEKFIKVRNSCKVRLRPGASEKANKKNFMKPYQDPRKVPLAEKAQACQETFVKGIRQASPVS